jgi:hypothetical protein
MRVATSRHLGTTLGSALARGTAMLLTGALITLIASAARGAEDPQYRLYRCAVLGDNNACPPSPRVPPVRIEERLEPGSYALYLMHLGRSEKDALAEAAAIGEFALRRVVLVTERQYTDAELYRIHLGYNVPSARSEVTLAVSVVKPVDEHRRRAGVAPLP